jgi:hypothetical protein
LSIAAKDAHEMTRCRIQRLCTHSGEGPCDWPLYPPCRPDALDRAPVAEGLGYYDDGEEHMFEDEEKQERDEAAKGRSTAHSQRACYLA